MINGRTCHVHVLPCPLSCDDAPAVGNAVGGQGGVGRRVPLFHSMSLMRFVRCSRAHRYDVARSFSFLCVCLLCLVLRCVCRFCVFIWFTALGGVGGSRYIVHSRYWGGYNRYLDNHRSSRSGRYDPNQWAASPPHVATSGGMLRRFVTCSAVLFVLRLQNLCVLSSLGGLTGDR